MEKPGLELDAHPLVNLENLETLRAKTANQPEFLLEIFRSYVEESQELIGEMQEAFQDNESDRYYQAVHSLKGLAGTLGIPRMFQLLKWMDALNKEQHFQDSAAELPRLQNIFDETSGYIRQEILKE